MHPEYNKVCQHLTTHGHHLNALIFVVQFTKKTTHNKQSWEDSCLVFVIFIFYKDTSTIRLSWSFCFSHSYHEVQKSAGRVANGTTKVMVLFWCCLTVVLFQMWLYINPTLSFDYAHNCLSFLLLCFWSQWATVTFHLPHHVLKLVASAIVSELKKINQNVAALSVASSIMDRLSYLLSSARPELGVGPGRSVDRWE